MADKNVTINCLLPGFFDTDRLRGGLRANATTLGKTEDEMEADRTSQIPARRFGAPEEFGETCAFLCSSQAGYITGQSLLIDGGMYNSAF